MKEIFLFVLIGNILAYPEFETERPKYEACTGDNPSGVSGCAEAVLIPEGEAKTETKCRCIKCEGDNYLAIETYDFETGGNRTLAWGSECKPACNSSEELDVILSIILTRMVNVEWLSMSISISTA